MSGKPNTDERLSKEERDSLAAQIKEQLTNFSLTQVWLIRQLNDVGLYTDKSEMSSVLSGTRLGGKADEILKKSAEVLSIYAERMCVGEAT
jgi:hypothetical protein